MPRKRSSCWTCHIRHKKCDGRLPVCSSCAALGITCHAVAGKPAWMDHGPEQHSMTVRLQSQVKQSAKQRRVRSRLDTAISKASKELGCAADHTEKLPSHAPTTRTELHGVSSAGDEGNIHSESNTGSNLDVQATPPAAAGGSELQLSLTMSYLDYVLPTLLPFYRPSIMTGGRGWLLVRILHSRALGHIITSLASYFFATVPVIPSPTFQLCSSQATNQLASHAKEAVAQVQRDIQTIAQDDSRLLIAQTRLLESIVHMMLMEAVRAGNWTIHLDAAIILMEQVMQRHTTLQDVLLQMGKPPIMTDASADMPALWNADQASFRFASAILVASDVLAAVTLGRAPRLLDKHAMLLHGEGQGLVQDVLGVQDWVLGVIGETAGLEAWGKQKRKEGDFSILEYARRGSEVERKLNEGLRAMTAATTTPAYSPTWEEEATSAVTPSEGLHCTRIWALAAQIYLHAVLSGWQPAAPAIQKAVTEVLDTLAETSSPARIRALAWPLCIAGCFANGRSRAAFYTVISRLGELGSLGILKAMVDAVERAWERGELEREIYSGFSAVLQSLGHPLLLI